MHKIFSETKRLVQIEKRYTAKILKNLMIIEKEKLYADLRYPSLYQYLRKELNYSDSEAVVRVNAVRLMLKSNKAQNKIKDGSLSLTNAAKTQQATKRIKDEKILEDVLEKAEKLTTRHFDDYLRKTFKKARQEILVLDERTLIKMDRLREKVGQLSSYELIQVMLERELKSPMKSDAEFKLRNCNYKNSRYISKTTKVQVYTGKCANCGKQYDLEYDHKMKFSHGGDNSPENIQILCRSCNQRKEIKAQQTNFFA